MTLFSLIVALLLEQLRPLPAARFVQAPLKAIARFLEDRFNDGESVMAQWPGGWRCWPPVSAVRWSFILWHITPLLGVLFNILILYLTMGFRDVSHFFTDIQLALRMGEIPRARQLLGDWRGVAMMSPAPVRLHALQSKRLLSRPIAMFLV
jgi:adenosylcobinamide-phosphate synthase